MEACNPERAGALSLGTKEVFRKQKEKNNCCFVVWKEKGKKDGRMEKNEMFVDWKE